MPLTNTAQQCKIEYGIMAHWTHSYHYTRNAWKNCKRCGWLVFEKRRWNLYSFLSKIINTLHVQYWLVINFFQYIISMKLWHYVSFIPDYFCCNNQSTRKTTLSVTRDRTWSLFELITNISLKDKAPAGSWQQQERKQTAVQPTAEHCDRVAATCSCVTKVQNLLPVYLNASRSSRGGPFSLYLSLSLATLVASSEIVAVIDLLKIISDPNFDKHLLNIQVKSIAFCQKHFRLYDEKSQTVMWCKLYYGFIEVVSVASL